MARAAVAESCRAGRARLAAPPSSPIRGPRSSRPAPRAAAPASPAAGPGSRPPMGPGAAQAPRAAARPCSSAMPCGDERAAARRCLHDDGRRGQATDDAVAPRERAAGGSHTRCQLADDGALAHDDAAPGGDGQRGPGSSQSAADDRHRPLPTPPAWRVGGAVDADREPGDDDRPGQREAARRYGPPGRDPVPSGGGCPTTATSRVAPAGRPRPRCRRGRPVASASAWSRGG